VARARDFSGAALGARVVPTLKIGIDDLVAAGDDSPTFGNPDEPPQGAINANPGSVTDPGPQNPALGTLFPSVQSPPATDVGGLPMDWASFNIAPRRI
jgi:oxalate decarboxylase